MSKKILRQLEKIKIMSIREEKDVINSWDVNYQENLKKYEKPTARFIIDEPLGPTEENDQEQEDERNRF